MEKYFPIVQIPIFFFQRKRREMEGWQIVQRTERMYLCSNWFYWNTDFKIWLFMTSKFQLFTNAPSPIPIISHTKILNYEMNFYHGNLKEQLRNKLYCSYSNKNVEVKTFKLMLDRFWPVFHVTTTLVWDIFHFMS